MRGQRVVVLEEAWEDPPPDAARVVLPLLAEGLVERGVLHPRAPDADDEPPGVPDGKAYPWVDRAATERVTEALGTGVR